MFTVGVSSLFVFNEDGCWMKKNQLVFADQDGLNA